jgi:hypothetical protein
MDSDDDIIEWTKANLLCDTYKKECPEGSNSSCKCNYVMVLITQTEYLRSISWRYRLAIMDLKNEIKILREMLQINRVGNTDVIGD